MSHILSAAEAMWDKASPFQVEDATFAAKQRRLVLGHETGLGKSFISMMAWARWPNANKALILGTLGSLASWSNILRKWAGVQPVFMQGVSSGFREFLQVKEGVYMCTYATYFHNMKAIHVGKFHTDLLIEDELHKFMRHRNETWKAIKRLEFEHYLGLSATWASRGPQDLFPVMNLMNHKTFSSYWRWVNTWCYVEKTEGMGTDIYGVRNEENLRKLLWSQYYRRREWKHVGNQFRKGNNVTEPVVRRSEIVPMGNQQRQLIDDLDRDMMVSLNGDMVVTPNSLALLTRKLQMAISPKILMPSAEYGGIIEWLVDRIDDDPHFVVFTPFKPAMEVLRQALIESKYPADRIFFLKGGMNPDETNATIARWKACKGIIMCTYAFAQSFPLDTTNNAYGMGFLWDPNDNYQAEGRLRRYDSILETPCNMTYIVPENSDYNQVLDVLNGKVMSTRGYLSQRLGKIDVSMLPLMDLNELQGDRDE